MRLDETYNNDNQRTDSTMAKRTGKVARAKELLPAFRDADARDQDEQIEVLARMDAAVTAAAAAYGDALSDKRRRRLALLLKHLHFCGGTKKGGSTMRISTMRRKLGSLAPSERTVKRDLELLYLWELIVTARKLRGTARKLNERLIDELIAAGRKLSLLKNKVSLVGSKLSPLDVQSVPSHLKSDTGQWPNCPPENKSALKSALKTRAREPPSATWCELVEVFGAEACEAARDRLTPFKRDLLLERSRSGGPINDAILDNLLEALEEVV